MAQDITQKQATEVVAVLNEHGVLAEAVRASGSKATYAVEVPQSDYSRAVGLLFQLGLPNEARTPFDELIAQRGLLPDSRDIENLRVDHALSVRLEELIEGDPGVVLAKAIVRQRALPVDQKPSVAVVVQTRAGSSVGVEEIRTIVERVLPGFPPENIGISIHTSSDQNRAAAEEGVSFDGQRVVRVPLRSFLLLWRVPEGDYNTLALSLVGVLILVVVAGALGGYWYSYLRQDRPAFEQDLRLKSLRLEQVKRNLPEV